MKLIIILAIYILLIGVIRFDISVINDFCSNLKIDFKSTNAIVVIADGVEVGSFSSKYTQKDMLQVLSKKYIEGLDINEEDIISVRIVGNLDFENKKISNESVKPLEVLANDLYTEMTVSCNSEEYSIEIITESTELKSIEPSTKIENTEEMYIGQSNIIEGQQGLSSVTSRKTYINGEEESNVIINETIINEPKSKIIYRGCKNPIGDKVEFLSHPTRGGDITSGFGERWNSFHSGMDIGKPIGDPVEAAIDGCVKEAGYNEFGYGNLVILEHQNGIQTYYAHLDSINVVEGQTINKGQIIGTVGNTGISTGPHLHFELRVDGEPINPVEYIK